MKPKQIQAMVVVAVVVFGLSFGPADLFAASQDGDAHPAFPARQLLAGSWQVTYDVPAFGGPFPLLLSLGSEGVVIETDAPGKFPLGPDVLVILSNGHGAWEPIRGRGAFAYLYRKLIYQEDGLTPFGITRTQARGKVSADGTAFQATLVIEIFDLAGQVLFETQGTAVATRIRVDQP